MKYPRGRPEPGEYSARQITVIGRIEQKRRNGEETPGRVRNQLKK